MRCSPRRISAGGSALHVLARGARHEHRLLPTWKSISASLPTTMGVVGASPSVRVWLLRSARRLVHAMTPTIDPMNPAKPKKPPNVHPIHEGKRFLPVVFAGVAPGSVSSYVQFLSTRSSIAM